MGLITKGFSFSTGTTAISAQVNTDFDTIYNEFNGSISGANLASNLVLTGNLTVDTPTLFVNSSTKRVGIGTLTPQVELHVLSGTSIASISIENSAGVAQISRVSDELRIFGSAAGSGTDRDISFHSLADGDGQKGKMFGNGHWSFNTISDIATVGVQSTDTGVIGLRVIAATGQTADLFRVDDDGSLELFGIESDGFFDFRLTMANGTDDPTTDSPVDWVEIKIAGVQRFIPVYN